MLLSRSEAPIGRESEVLLLLFVSLAGILNATIIGAM